MSNGRHPGTRSHSGGTRSPLTRSRAHAPRPSGSHAEPRLMPILSLRSHVSRGAPHGIRPDDGKTEAIRVFRTPQSASDVRRFLGLANQLGKFSPHLASISQPLRELLSKGKAWTWDHAQQTAFEATKEELCKPTCLQLYDPNYSTKLPADASSYGLGAVFYQRSSPETSWRPVACASRSLTPAERNYAQIEK